MKTALENLLERAVAAHQNGELARALELYAAILQTDPLHYDALHLSGVVARQQGQPERALRLIIEALKVRADQANAFCNLGAALQDLDRPREARSAYEQAIKLRPDYPMALTNLANTLRKLGEFDAALSRYDAAISLEANRRDAHVGKAATLLDLMRFAQALTAYRSMLALDPDDAHAWMGVGAALQGQGHHDDALDAYQRSIALDPTSGETYFLRGTLFARLQRYALALESLDLAVQCDFLTAGLHLARGDALRNLGDTALAALAYDAAGAAGGDPETVNFRRALAGAGDLPEKAPRADVEKLFDRYASHFESHLLGALEYRAPSELVATLRTQFAAPIDSALDLGCGTGLAGVDLRPWVRRLVGLDLSAVMLAKAKARAIYDDLIHDDAIEFMRRSPECFDVIVATDVLVYIGELGPLFKSVRARLKPGGRFAFTTENSNEAGVALRSTGRFAHTQNYVQTQLQANDLAKNGSFVRAICAAKATSCSRAATGWCAKPTAARSLRSCDRSGLISRVFLQDMIQHPHEI